MLLTNDDGIRSSGLRFLMDVASEFGDVTAVAPDRDQSGVGQAISLTSPLRLFRTKSDERVYGLSGTPTDCVYIGLHHVMKDNPPDFILSGVNTGANLGWDIHYSGTAAGAREGVLQGLPAAAFSLIPASEGFPWEKIRPWLRDMLARILENPPPAYTFYNVNFPNPHTLDIRGVRSTTLGQRNYAKSVDVRKDPRGHDYLWLGGSGVHMPHVPGSDCNAITDGFVSITPIQCDVTDKSTLANMQDWSTEK
jgi:5'-nucleotidase